MFKIIRTLKLGLLLTVLCALKFTSSVCPPATISALDLIGNQQFQISEDIAIGHVLFNISSSATIILESTSKNILNLRRSNNEYKLVIEEKPDREGGLDKLTAYKVRCDTYSVTFVLSVDDVNESPPKFIISNGYAVNISEATRNNTDIFSLANIAKDPDVSQHPIEYSLQDGYGYFAVENNQIITINILDYDSGNTRFNLTIIAQEIPSGGSNDAIYRNNSVSITVNIKDVDDKNPRFTHTIYRLNISEGNYQNTIVNTTPPVFAEDLDSFKEPVGYTISGGDGMFSIRSTGEVVINGILSRIQRSFIGIGVKAFQVNGPVDRTSNAAILVTIQDINDNNPIMSNNSYAAEVEEGIYGDVLILQVSASDLDMGINSVFKFNLSGTTIFDITTLENTGSIKLARGKTLDRETNSKYVFQVYAWELETDEHRESTRSTVTITVLDINDNRPIFYQPSNTSPIQYSVNKTAEIGHVIGQVYANDSDIGNNGKVSYILLQAVEYFRINNETGEIMVNRSLRSKIGIINMEIIAADNPDNLVQTRQTIKPIIVTVEDVDTEAPRITNLNKTINISEDIDRYSIIYNVQAYDPDLPVNDTLRYGLVGNQVFTIDSSGTIRTNGTLDREMINRYHILVTVFGDRKVTTGVLIVNILDVNDNNPFFNKAEYNLTILEGEAPPYSPGSNNPIQAYDADIGINAALIYSLLTPRGVSVPFSVNSTTGLIFATSELDREARDVYDLYVSVKDSGTPPRSANVPVTIHVVDINDNGPIFTKTHLTLSFPEDSHPGCFYSAKASDMDIGNNKDIYYTLENTDQNLIDVFSNGSICVRNNQSLPLGRFILNITAYNSQPFSGCSTCSNATLLLDIEVTDINNHNPVFDQDFYNISMNEEKTHLNISVHATDNDTTTVYQNVLYTIITDTDRFYIDSVTGEIYFETQPDYDPPRNEKIFYLTVGAKNTGSSVVATSVNVTIHINDINDNTPKFDKENYQCSVGEGIANGSAFGCKVTANDIDSALNGEIEYSIRDSANFSIHHASGELRIDGSIDFETGPRQYSLTIQATDKGIPQRIGFTTVIVIVNNLNDNKPHFINTPYNFTLLEIQRANSLVGVISASDKDFDNLTYTLISSDFRITNRGSIYATRDMDVDSSTPVFNYALMVNASDGVHTSTEMAYITIQPVNEYTPYFTDIFSGNIPENATAGTSVTQITADDNDAGADGDISYSIGAGNTANTFRIDRISGIVKLDCNNCLDYNNKSVYELLIQARDGGDDPRHNFTTVQINIVDVNNKPPKFTNPIYQISMSENEAVGRTVVRVIATDDDTPQDQLQYTLNNYRNIFTMKGHDVVLNNTIDGDQLPSPILTLNISVSDREQLDTTLVNITITDVNEHPPVPNNKSLYISLPENVTVGYKVMEIVASDRDFSNDGFTYWLTNEDNKFKINLTSGILKVKNRFDRSLKSIYNVTVHISDHGTPPMFAEAHLNIKILDSNTAPVFDNKSYSFTVLENVAVGSDIGFVHATDADYGSSGEVVYSIISGNTDITFGINSTNGHILTKNKVDHEAIASFRLVVQANDRSSIVKMNQVQVEITVLDSVEAPRWPTSLPIVYLLKSKVCEDSQVTAFPSDATTYDSGSIVVYNLLNWNDIFSINNETGTLQSNSQINSGQYNLTLQACNSKNLLLCNNATLRVIVTEEDRLIFCPAFITKYIPENFEVNNTITILNSTSNSNRTDYQITFGDNDTFLVGSPNGELKLHKSLDRETTSSYTLLIRAYNPVNSQTATAQVIIHVTDLPDSPPYFLNSVYRGVVKETAVLGDFVMSHGQPLVIKAIDTDLNPQLNYTIIESSHLKSFSIDGISGHIIVDTELDRENKSSFSFLVNVTDGYFNNSTAVEVTVIDVNDVYPMFEKTLYSKSVLENVTVNSVILVVNATDEDSSDFGNIKYKLEEKVINFDVDSDTGELRLILPLDRENVTHFNFNVIAVDGVGHNATSRVNITVLDVNDNFPIFSQDVYNITVEEGMASLNKTIHVTATDRDINNGLIYIIVGSDTNFNITTVNNEGIITITSVLDREKPNVRHIDGDAIYSLQIEAVDSGIPAKSGTCMVNVYVKDVNDNPPIFNITKQIYFGTVEEESQSGTRVILNPVLIVTDRDYGTNGIAGLIYSLLPNSAPFTINNKTGEILVALSGNMSLDRETKSFYQLQIIVEDSGGLKNSKNVSVTVLDKNDEAPQFNQHEYIFNVKEDAGPSAQVGMVSAYDTDNDGNSSVRYNLVQNGEGRFFIDGLSGLIRVAGGLNREIDDTYQLKVIAEDQSGYTGSATVIVNILDVNDNPPHFTQTNYNFTVPENAAGVIIGFVNATDEDLGENQDVWYSVNDTAFKIGDEGGLKLMNALDRELVSFYQLTVSATDRGSPSLSSEVQIYIYVIDINDNSPVFCIENDCQNQNYSTTIVNGLPTNSFVWRAVASDRDFGVNGTVTFDLQGSTAHFFDIGLSNGIITNRDFDLNKLVDEGFVSNNQTNDAVLLLEINATDGGGRSSVVYLNISINIITTDIPKFSQTMYNMSITENQPRDTTVDGVVASLSNMTDVVFNYVILYGDEKDAHSFTIGSNTGIIKSNVELNREGIDRYLFVVQVTDGRIPEQTAYTQVRITVKDENDNIPQFDQTSYKTTVKENKSNITLLTVTARDSDIGINSMIAYSIINGNNDNYFTIDEVSGEVRVIVDLDREVKSSHVLTVEAQDGGVTALSSSVEVVIVVEDTNDNTPEIHVPKTVVYVRETNRQVSEILQINATDPDEELNGEVLYSIVKGDQNIFQINPISGWLSTMRALLQQYRSTYHLTIMAYNLGTPIQNSTIELTINVINSTTPQFATHSYTIDIFIGMKIGAVLHVNLTAGTGHYIYEIISGNAGNVFTIKPSDGELSLLQDVKEVETYNIVIKATDLADDKSSDTVNVIVSVRKPDVKFDQTEYNVHIEENVKIGHLIVDLNTTVENEGLDVIYAIEGGDANFKIDSENGSIYTIAQIDREVKAVYTLIVRVTSLIQTTRNKRTANSDTTRVLLSIDDINDNPPYFQYPYDVMILTIPKSASSNQLLTKLEIYDPDPALAEFRITGGDDTVFSVDIATGEVKSLVDMTDVDRDQFQLNVSATDTNSSLSSNISLIIYMVPDGNRYILTGNISLPVFVNFQNIFLRNLSNILDMTIELDNVQSHSYINSGKKVIDPERSDVYIKAYYKPENTKLVPWKEIQKKAMAEKRAIDQLFQTATSYVTDKPASFISNEGESLGIAEMTLLALACSIFIGSTISIVLVVRSWKISERQLRNRLSFKDFERRYVLESLKPVPEVIITEEQERVLIFDNEAYDGDTLRYKEIVLGRTVMDIENDILNSNVDYRTTNNELPKVDIVISPCEPLYFENRGADRNSEADANDSNQEANNVHENAQIQNQESNEDSESVIYSTIAENISNQEIQKLGNNNSHNTKIETADTRVIHSVEVTEL